MNPVEEKVRLLGLTTQQAWVPSVWEGNGGPFGAKWVIRYLCVAIAAGMPYAWLTSGYGFFGLVATLPVVLGLTIVLLYVARHIPTATRLPVCATCTHRRRSYAGRLCENCGRVNEIVDRARRRDWRSL